MKKATKDLITARALLAVPGVWVQGGAAFDKDDRSIDCFDEDACKFCMYGALWNVSGYNSTAEAFLDIETNDTRGWWNDQEGRKLEEVLQAYDRAIARSKTSPKV